MTPRQQIAISYPCARAVETMDRRYWDGFEHSRKSSLSWSTILSVNK